ncbi:hypothetical protein BC826DRAFT_1016748 [Russula brevipes]|nr:hypothetical protein BC826DRAFT_1016748 [Russula brevipes]
MRSSRRFLLIKPIAATHAAPAQSSIAEGHNDETASITDLSDEEEKEIDNVEYLLVLQQIRQEARKFSKSNYKRQFSTLSAEFRGHASVMAEEMNAYIDEMEKDALDTRNRECIGAQDVINAAPEWKPQHVSILLSHTIMSISKRARSMRRESSILVASNARRT